MFKHNDRSKVFNLGNIRSIFSDQIESIKSSIERETENYILNINESDYVNHLATKHILDCPEILFDDVYADSYEDKIPAEYFPFGYDVDRGFSYSKQVIQYIIPAKGNIKLLLYHSVNSMFVDGDFFIKDNTLITEFINFNNDIEKIKRDYDSKLKYLKANYANLKQDITIFNINISDYAKNLFTERRDKILQKNNLMSSLGVPLKTNKNVSDTFSVPQPKLKEQISIKPSVREKGFKPEPTLDEKNYNKILKLINDIGKNFERLPSVYKDKHEEDLRDHILLTLDPNFEYGSASGETFNKSGKTDIQLRYDSSVVFIAECKFWSGEKNYLTTISQLLNYLTWRDTKASVVVFVKQKDFSSILNKVEITTPQHENYLGFANKSDENWFNYRFHVNGDSNREVKLAIQLYHLP